MPIPIPHEYACADPKRNFSINIREGALDMEVIVTMDVYGVHCGDQISITSSRCIPLDHLLGEKDPHHPAIRQAVQSAIYELVTHEVDEWLRCQGQPIREAH